MISNSETLESVMSRLLDFMSQFSFFHGTFQTNIPFLSLLREVKPSVVESGILDPSICIVIQGNKKLIIGEKSIEYGAGNYISSSIDMPISGQVLKASLEAPYTAIRIIFTSEEIASVVLEANIKPRQENQLREGAFVGNIGLEVLLVFERLLHLSSDSQTAAFLAPTMKREIIYRLLIGEDGGVFYNSMLLHHETSGISKAIHHVKANFDRSITVDQIARIGNMSTSTLHHKFKAVTTLTPIQYQKQLRLQEARRILLGGGVDVTIAAFQVGYESLTQFNREYKRLFGLPPLKDIQTIRAKKT
ncbi:AraC family transcriptional regulator [Paenibacillus psychroresistens]|uniref:AraC family transcriptional regulator n=1 Tax=Paenibacillus psychroresistens TaxID=1778678 RepID=A0A6B8RMW5_9BACL|nr:AraC family transcriptional regulator [Paenibacillus psychroresistens]QGQ97650.1 AraC family transcriptional regulator [Paenibacillus psychroresistens]